MNILIIIFGVFVSCGAICRQGLVTNVDRIARNLLHYGNDTDNFTIKALKDIPLARFRHPAMCESCAVVMNYVVSHRKQGASKQSMVEYLKRLCYKFLDWSKVYCNGRIENEVDAMLFILDNRNITGKRICSIQLVHMNCSDPDEVKWEIPLSKYQRIRPTGKWLQGYSFYIGFSDIHYDPEYQAGRNAICNEPVCCQQGNPKNESHKAGYWADHRNCELPWHTILEFIPAILRDEGYSPIQFYAFGGDVVSQSSWKSTRERVKTSLQSFYSLVRNTNWKRPFFPALGEFDTHPPGLPINVTNLNVSTKWLFDLLSNEWSSFVNKNAGALRTIRAGGYYTMEFSSELDIIVLNTNVCLNRNLWLIYEDKDPYGQLMWLVGKLEEYEKIKKRVYILQHVPVGYVHCHKNWSKQFARILHRYMFTVASVIYGHEHYSTFKLLSHPTDQIQMLPGWGLGSLTAYDRRNPTYHVLYSETVTKVLVSSILRSLDILKANDEMWKRIDNFNKKSLHGYSYIGLDVSELNGFFGFINKLKNQFTRLEKKYFNWYVSNFTNPMECNYRCKKTLACMSLSITTEESIRCQYYP